MASPALITYATRRMSTEGSKVGGGVSTPTCGARGEGPAGKTESDGEGNERSQGVKPVMSEEGCPRQGKSPQSSPVGAEARACGICTAYVNGDGAESGPRDNL